MSERKGPISMMLSGVLFGLGASLPLGIVASALALVTSYFADRLFLFPPGLAEDFELIGSPQVVELVEAQRIVVTVSNITNRPRAAMVSAYVSDNDGELVDICDGDTELLDVDESRKVHLLCEGGIDGRFEDTASIDFEITPYELDAYW